MKKTEGYDLVNSTTLAINGGAPVRPTPMPERIAFGDQEVASLMEVIEYYRSRNQDPPYQGIFERRLSEAFCAFMSGGYADGVSTGTAACFVAIAALDLPASSEIIISPVTDSGPLNSILFQGFVPVVADAMPDSFNMGVEQFLERITPRTSAVFAVHAAGEPLAIDRITKEAHNRSIKVIEDCSQAPGAVCASTRVGAIGDVAAFSTMYRKTLATGGSGGIVYSCDIDTHHRGLAAADRGKPAWRTDVNLADPSTAQFVALNFNTNEFSSAIGLASLERMQEAIDKRIAFVDDLIAQMKLQQLHACKPYNFHHGFSPFFFPIFVETELLSCTKNEFAHALMAEGIPLNPDYGCIISDWNFAKEHLSDDFVATNAQSTRQRSFNLFLNERYGNDEANDIVRAMAKVEQFFTLA